MCYFFHVLPLSVSAQDVSSDVEKVTAQELRESAAEINSATQSEVVTTTETGTLVEIGNTTADFLEASKVTSL